VRAAQSLYRIRCRQRQPYSPRTVRCTGLLTARPGRDEPNDDHASGELTSHSLTQLRNAFGAMGRLLPNWALRTTCGSALRRFVNQVIDYDSDIARRGFPTASRDLLDRIVPSIMTCGSDRVPADGPLLIVSNHPGLYDTIALAAYLRRSDLRVVARQQAYWGLLPNLSQQLITLRGEPQSFRLEMRKALRHLAAGRSLLLYPGGTIEPDPVYLSGADAWLPHWSRTPERLARRLGELTILPAAVGGVLSRRALRSPLSWIRWSREGRCWLAATLQFLVRSNRDVTLRVSFGQPIRWAQRDGRGDTERLRERIHASMRRELANVGQRNHGGVHAYQ
jgi:1-acyl-sn-glycerol-3-phosphate acyltransferase